MAGGITAGLFGCRAYIMGYSTVLALPIFEDTIVGMSAAIVVAILVAAIVTFLLGFEETCPDTGVISDKNIDNSVNNHLVAIADGKMIPIENVNDETFSSKMLGDGVAFELEGTTIAAPCTGTLSLVAETGHAFGITREDGVEFIVHIGIDTVAMNGTGFSCLAHAGMHVKAGDPIIETDLKMLKEKGYDMTTMLIIANPNGKDIAFREYGSVKKGERVDL